MNTSKTIAIIDYGLGNLYSLNKAMKLFTSKVVITDNPNVIISADAVIVPGVGAFAIGMREMKARNLIDPIKNFAASGKPMLGICLGAQLMLSKGFEFGEHSGLDIISGKVEIFPETVARKEKIPHIGWNEIYFPAKNKNWDGTIFAGIPEKANMYFVHSYVMVPDYDSNVAALAEYGGLKFCAAIKMGNVYGTQFHPEKSGEAGLIIIKNFVNLTLSYDGFISS